MGKALRIGDLCSALKRSRRMIHYYIAECEFPAGAHVAGVRGNRWVAASVIEWLKLHPIEGVNIRAVAKLWGVAL